MQPGTKARAGCNFELRLRRSDLLGQLAWAFGRPQVLAQNGWLPFGSLCLPRQNMCLLFFPGKGHHLYSQLWFCFQAWLKQQTTHFLSSRTLVTFWEAHASVWLYFLLANPLGKRDKHAGGSNPEATCGSSRMCRTMTCWWAGFPVSPSPRWVSSLAWRTTGAASSSTSAGCCGTNGPRHDGQCESRRRRIIQATFSCLLVFGWGGGGGRRSSWVVSARFNAELHPMHPILLAWKLLSWHVHAYSAWPGYTNNPRTSLLLAGSGCRMPSARGLPWALAWPMCKT